MPNGSTAHEVLAVVFQVREVTEQVKGGPRTGKPQLNVLLWQRAQDPQRGAWSLPGGRLRNDEDLITSVRRQLARRSTCKSWRISSNSRRSPIHTGLPGPRRSRRPSLAWCPPPPPRNCRRTLAGTGEFATTDGIRPWSDGGPRAHPLGGQNVVHEYWICLSSKRIRAFHAARHLFGCTGPPGRRHQSATGARPPRRHHSDRNHRAVRGAAAVDPRPMYHFTDSRLRVTDEFAALRPPGVIRRLCIGFEPRPPGHTEPWTRAAPVHWAAIPMSASCWREREMAYPPGHDVWLPAVHARKCRTA